MFIRRTALTARIPGHFSLAGALLLVALLTLAACGPTSGGASSAGQPSGAATPTGTAAGASGVRYVALGASDAVGVGASDPNRTAYVPIIISRLPKGSAALNLGISGATVHQALQDELPQAIAAKPTLVTVWLVGNDFKSCVPLQQYGADLDTLLTQLQRQTTAQVFVANAPDFSALPAVQAQAASGSFCGVPGSQASIRGLAQQWNQVINASVAAHHDTLVDLFNSDLASHPGYVASDGFHPSDQGYLALANLFWSAITAQGAAQANAGKADKKNRGDSHWPSPRSKPRRRGKTPTVVPVHPRSIRRSLAGVTACANASRHTPQEIRRREY